MKPFNLEAAKAGAPVCTRDGRDVRILCYDQQNDTYPIVSLVTLETGKERVNKHTINGNYLSSNVIHKEDLMMKTVKRTGWVHIYPNDVPGNRIYRKYEDAVDRAQLEGAAIVTIAEIAWER